MEIMELVDGNIDSLMGEFMREQDIEMVRGTLNGDEDHIEMLRQGMASNADMASHYRRGVQLCMRYAYWKPVTIPEGSVFTDASGCVWVTTDQNNDGDMLVMRTAQDIPVVDLVPNESWLRAIGFIDAMDYLTAAGSTSRAA